MSFRTSRSESLILRWLHNHKYKYHKWYKAGQPEDFSAVEFQDNRFKKGFIGLASYYRIFSLKFAKLAQPLHGLLKKNTKWRWTEVEEAAKEALTKKLIVAPFWFSLMSRVPSRLRRMPVCLASGRPDAERQRWASASGLYLPQDC